MMHMHQTRPSAAAGPSACEAAAWDENIERQKSYEVHEQTRSIVLLFADVDHWPACEVSKQPGWERLSEVAIPVMHEIIRKWYPPGGTIIRAMAARLEVGGTIKPHTDAQESFVRTHRIHIPLTSNGRVRFTVDGRPCPMSLGRAYEINNQKMHSVMNRGKEPRISFIFDYFPPPATGREA